MPSEDDPPTLFNLDDFAQKPPSAGSCDADATDVGDDGDGEDLELIIPALSEEVGRDIFSLASDVRKLEPWKALHEQDFFGVRDPSSGEIHLTSVSGGGRRHLAVQLFLPPEGMRFWMEVMAHGEPSYNMIHYSLRMIECEFVGKKVLEKEDLEACNRFSPKPGHGKRNNAYPQFRSYLPGYIPWPPEDAEASLLANALRLIPRFLEFIKPNATFARFYDVAGPGGLPMIPLFELKDGGDAVDPHSWEIGACEFPAAAPEPLPHPPVDELFATRMASFDVKGTELPWECGIFFSGETVHHRGRIAFIKLITTAVDIDFAIKPQIGTVQDCPMTLVRRSLADAADAMAYLPAVIRYQNPLVEVALRDIAREKGIQLEAVESLPRLEALWGELMKTGPQGIPEMLQQLSGVDLSQLEKTFGGKVPTELLDQLKGLLAEVQKPGEMAETEEPEYRPPGSPERYVMRIELLGSHPPIWRRISMPVDASFFDLHAAIQDAIGWDDSHMHTFEIRKGKSRVPKVRIEWSREPARLGSHGVEELHELETTLEQMVKRRQKKFFYTYDFGDDWDHSIVIEEKLPAPQTPKGKTNAAVDTAPKLLGGEGACPPEDCGGIGGYIGIMENDPDAIDGLDPKWIKEVQNAKFDPDQVKFYSAESMLVRDPDNPFF